MFKEWQDCGKKEFESFCETYMGFMESWSELKLNKDMLHKLYSKIFGQTQQVFNYLKEFCEFNSLINELGKIDHLLSIAEFIVDVRWKYLINHLIVFSSQQPAIQFVRKERLHSTYEYKSIVDHYFIRSITPYISTFLISQINSILEKKYQDYQTGSLIEPPTIEILAENPFFEHLRFSIIFPEDTETLQTADKTKSINCKNNESFESYNSDNNPKIQNCGDKDVHLSNGNCLTKDDALFKMKEQSLCQNYELGECQEIYKESLEERIPNSQTQNNSESKSQDINSEELKNKGYESDESFQFDNSILISMIYFSLCQLSSEFKKEILQDELFNLVLNSPVLFLWSLACSNAHEQYYLNTCETTSVCNSFISQHPIFPTLIICGEILLRFVENRIPMASKYNRAYLSIWGNFFVPSAYEFTKSIASEVRSDLYKLRGYLKGYLEKEAINLKIIIGDPISYIRKLEKKFHIWVISMQKLSSVFYTQEPAVLTRKIIPQNWLLSSRVMTIFSLISQFFPGWPLATSRLRAPHQIETSPIYLIHLSASLLPPFPTEIDYFGFQDVVSNSGPQNFIKPLKKLWLKWLWYGGLLFSNLETIYKMIKIGHMSFGIPIIKDNQLAFFISDPEIRGFKSLDCEYMFKLCSSEKMDLDFLDATFFQFERKKKLILKINFKKSGND